MSGRARLVVGAAVLGGTLVAWRMRERLSDRLTDNLARRPSGWLGRRFYREAKPHQQAFRETLDALALGPADRLLELGCGGGTFVDWALATGCTARAIDHSPDMLDLARERNAQAVADGRLELRDADARHLPFVDGEFTAAATTNAFFFFDEPQAVLAEVHRTLAPDRRIAIYTDATAFMAPPPVARRMHFYSDEELRGLLERAGYTQINLQRKGPGGRMQLATARKAASEPARPG
ncbi:MAG: class I SAM-dependent methyltransferase [Solirubrobacteraceae bacterium]